MKQEARWIRIAGFLLIAVVPILGSIYMIDRFLQEKEIAQARQLDDGMTDDYFHFLLEGNPRENLCRQFYAAFDFLKEKKFAQKAIENMPMAFSPGLGVEIAPFTPDGKLVLPKWGTLRVKFAVKKLWSDLLTRKFVQKNLQMYRAFLGPGFFPWDAEEKSGYPFLIITDKGDGTFIFKRFGKAGGLLAFIQNHPPEKKFLRETLRKVSSRGLWAVYDPTTRKLLRKGGALYGWKNFLSKAILTGPGTYINVSTSSSIFQLRKHAEGFWILRGFPSSLITTHQGRTILWVSGQVTLLGLFFFWFGSQKTPFERLSISYRLFFFFMAAILLPLAYLLNMGLTSYRLQRQAETEKLHNLNLTRLRGIDFAAQKHLEDLTQRFRQLRDSDLFRSNNKEKIVATALDLRQRKIMGRVEARDIHGEEIAKVEGTEKQTTALIRLFSKEVLKRYLKAVMPRSNLKLERFTMDFLLSPCFDFTRLFDRPDSLSFMSSGRLSATYWYWDIMPPTTKHPVAFLFFMQYKQNMIKNFLKKPVPPSTFLFDSEMRKWTPYPVLKKCAVLVHRAFLNREPCKQIIQSDRGRFLISAFPGMELKGFIYLAISDLEPLEKQLQEKNLELLILAVLTVVLTIFFAMILSRSLLEPISKFSEGIKALENRQFHFRLPPLGKDEFGLLAQTLNETIEGMHELDIGREVQRNLLPQKPPIIPGYKVAFLCESATDLGGDYLDCFGDSSGKFVFIAGDVTGHGVSAALLMAMAKAACHVSRKEGSPVVKYIERVNKLINKMVGKRKLMSMAMGILSLETNEMEWITVGHPYPLLLEADGNAGFLQMSQYPLGVVSKGKWKTQTVQLKPGEQVVFYTDGLYEAANSRQEPFGFDRLQQVVEANRNSAAQETLDAIMALYHSHTEGLPANDDLTLLVVSRDR